MRFSFSAEQEEFRTTLRRALEARSPTKEVRRLMATDAGFDREGWQKLNQELGLTAVHIPEAYGGRGFGYSRAGHRARGDGPRPALRAVLLDRGAGHHRDPECRHGGAEEGAAARHRRRRP